jgi:hypothetical protein
MVDCTAANRIKRLPRYARCGGHEYAGSIRDDGRHVHPRQRMQNICTEAVRYDVNATLGEDDRQKPINRSLYRYLLQEMAEASMKYAIAENIDTAIIPLSATEADHNSDGTTFLLTVAVHHSQKFSQT